MRECLSNYLSMCLCGPHKSRISASYGDGYCNLLQFLKLVVEIYYLMAGSSKENRDGGAHFSPNFGKVPLVSPRSASR